MLFCLNMIFYFIIGFFYFIVGLCCLALFCLLFSAVWFLTIALIWVINRELGITIIKFSKRILSLIETVTANIKTSIENKAKCFFEDMD